MGYKSYKDDVEKAMKKGEKDALIMIGLFLQGAASLLATVITGRMRASITYIVEDVTGGIGTDDDGRYHPEDKPHGKGPKNTLVFGTNVKYAPPVEKKKPFLEPAFTHNISKLKKITNKAMMEAMK